MSVAQAHSTTNLHSPCQQQPLPTERYRFLAARRAAQEGQIVLDRMLQAAEINLTIAQLTVLLTASTRPGMSMADLGIASGLGSVVAQQIITTLLRNGKLIGLTDANGIAYYVIADHIWPIITKIDGMLAMVDQQVCPLSRGR
jgi:hypothetical protein